MINYFEKNLSASENEQNNLSFEEKLLLIQKLVEDVYKRSNAPKEQIKSFKDHNAKVLDYALELAKKEKLTKKNLQILKLATALHDVAKLNTPLVKHGFAGAKIAYEQLIKLGFNKRLANKVSRAIARHMGPLPRFMAGQVIKWEKEKGEKITFPRPKTKVEQLLYDADMLSLIDRQGIAKILIIRKNVEVFQKEDEETAKKKQIIPEEAAWTSALQSARQAADSLFTKAAKMKAKQLLQEAEKLFEEFKL